MENTEIPIAVVQMDLLRWVGYLVVALLGGFASSLINNKGTISHIGWDYEKGEDQGKRKKLLHVGLVADLAAGLAAALAILWTMTPQTVFQLIGMGAVAGYGGSAVLQALLNRLVADISETEKGKVQGEKSVIEGEKKKLEDNWSSIIQDETTVDKLGAEGAIAGLIAVSKKRATSPSTTSPKAAATKKKAKGGKP